MNKDLNFLAKSSLSQYYNFSSKNDPFLVHPTTPSNEGGGDKLIHYISKNLYTRIRACELILLEETVSHKNLNNILKSASGSRVHNQSRF